MSVTESKSEVFTIAGADTGETTTEKGKNNPKQKICTIYEQYVQPCLAELFGTTLFVFVGCASVIGNVGVQGSIQPAVAHGLALGVLIMVLGQISGGHFNPAVSLSVYLCGGMELTLLGPYVLAQLSGGMIGAGLAKAIYPSPMFMVSSGGAFNVVKTTGALGGATVAEMMMTLFLTTVVCMGAVNSRTRSQSAPFCIGLTVTASILAGGSVSGACMNPARALGPAVVANYWDHHWIYWVGPTCGALLTVSFIRLLFGDQKTRVMLK
ncbi:aquaporin-8a.1 [Centroberyx gerrardi]|uniref:aquaporin-8a.1 n=1 Tax=Centroberyx gerrardi TaxID=166262 RepID=UPI003AAF2EC2